MGLEVIMSTPLGDNEPQAFGYDPRDELLTIQGFVPESVTATRKEAAQSVTHFSTIANAPASEQAKYFLNAFWLNLQPGQAERIYNEWKVFRVVQKEAGQAEDSPAIAQNLANLFLQRLKRTMSVQDFKDEFKRIDTNFDGKMAYLEYLVWDSGFGTPASVIYRPQVQSNNLGRRIKNVLTAEANLRQNADDLAALEEKVASLSGVKKTTAQNQLATFRENNDVAGLNAQLASAQNSLAKERKSLSESGTQFWNDRIQAELDSLKPTKRS